MTGSATRRAWSARSCPVTPISADVQLLIDRSFSRGRGARHLGGDRTRRRPGRSRTSRCRTSRHGTKFPQGGTPEYVFTVSYDIGGQHGRYPPSILIGAGLVGARGSQRARRPRCRSAPRWTSPRSSSCWCCRRRPTGPARDPARHRDRGDRHHRRAAAVDGVRAAAAARRAARAAVSSSRSCWRCSRARRRVRWSGSSCGLAQDMFLNQPKGITALTLTLLGYAVGMARQYIVSPSPLVPTIVVAIGDRARHGVLRGRRIPAGEVRRDARRTLSGSRCSPRCTTPSSHRSSTPFCDA